MDRLIEPRNAPAADHEIPVARRQKSAQERYACSFGIPGLPLLHGWLDANSVEHTPIAVYANHHACRGLRWHIKGVRRDSVHDRPEAASLERRPPVALAVTAVPPETISLPSSTFTGPPGRS